MRGERIFAGAVGLFGLLWISQALRLRYWGDFAPGSGFLPFWLGVALVALVALFLFFEFRARGAAPDPAPQAAIDRAAVGRIGAIVGGLVATVAVLDTLGFVLSVGAYLAFLVGGLERRSLAETTAVALGTVAAIHVVFRVWLKVPLPAGPWGF